MPNLFNHQNKYLVKLMIRGVLKRGEREGKEREDWKERGERRGRKECIIEKEENGKIERRDVERKIERG